MFPCRPRKKIRWELSLANYRLNLATASFGIFFDVLLLLAPIWVLHQNMMFSLRVVRIAFVFAVGKASFPAWPSGPGAPSSWIADETL